MERYYEDLIGRLGLSKTDVAYWYKARHYVLNIMKPIDGCGIALNSPKYVHVVIDKVNPLTLALIRQICLIAHYPNYKEDTGSCRTVFSIYSQQPEEAFKQVRSCCYLGNLLNYCRCTINGIITREEDINLPLDIEFEFLSDNPLQQSMSSDKEIIVDIKSEKVEKEVSNYDQLYMDVTKGMLVNMVYNTGVEIDNLPACDNDNISRYSTALNVFCYKLKPTIIREAWLKNVGRKEDGSYDLIAVKNQLSSVFCGDCFESKLRSIMSQNKNSVTEQLIFNFSKVNENVCKRETINALVRCEHARWNVEKLIMGFGPLLPKQWYQLECCFGTDRKALIKKWKKAQDNPRHIDLCSYKDLRRVNPGDMKYDYFLILAMPSILKEVWKQKRTD